MNIFYNWYRTKQLVLSKDLFQIKLSLLDAAKIYLIFLFIKLTNPSSHVLIYIFYKYNICISIKIYTQFSTWCTPFRTT